MPLKKSLRLLYCNINRAVSFSWQENILKRFYTIIDLFIVFKGWSVILMYKKLWKDQDIFERIKF